jgi:hypothetical protein
VLLKRTPADDVLIADGHVFGDGNEGVEALVVFRAIDVEAKSFAVARKGMAVGASVEAGHHRATLWFRNVAQTPFDKRKRGSGERLDGTLLRVRRGHERNIAIENGSADGIDGSRDCDAAHGDGRTRIVAGRCSKAGDGNRGGRFYGGLLDFRPGGGVGSPSARGGLLGSELRELGASAGLRIDLAHLQVFAGRVDTK